MPRERAWGYGLPALLATVDAQAHSVSGHATGFVNGFLHPVSGLDHVLAMVAVGLWGAQLKAPALWVLPLTFPMMMAVGGFLGLIGVALPGVESGIAVSSIVLGGLILCAVRTPISVAVTVVAVFAIYHGYAHGAELPPGGNALLYSAGFIIATGALHACGIAIGLLERRPGGPVAIRCLGALVMAAGLIFLGKALS